MYYVSDDILEWLWIEPEPASIPGLRKVFGEESLGFTKRVVELSRTCGEHAFVSWMSDGQMHCRRYPLKVAQRLMARSLREPCLVVAELERHLMSDAS